MRARGSRAKHDEAFARADQRLVKGGQGRAKGWPRAGQGLVKGWPKRVTKELAKAEQGLAKGWSRAGQGMAKGWPRTGQGTCQGG